MLVTAGLDAADRLHIGAGHSRPVLYVWAARQRPHRRQFVAGPDVGDAWARPSRPPRSRASPLHLAGRADPGHRPVSTHWAEVEDAVHFQHRTTERNGVRVRDARPEHGAAAPMTL
ncbi:hypothetical protein [Streptomyces sp. NPDC004592]